jgi:hypothetical protein
MPLKLSGPLKVKLCQRLGENWRDLAIYLEIPPDHQRRFDQGYECQAILTWLEGRRQLGELPTALKEINRQDLADLLGPPQSPPEEKRHRSVRIVDPGDPANFDLEEFNECLDFISSKPGLIGICVAIAVESTRYFPEYLQKRLQAVLADWRNGGEIYVPPSISLRASFSSIDGLIQDLMPYKLRLDTTDILLTVRADNKDRLARFWQQLRREFSMPLKYYFLVLIIKEDAFESPQPIAHDFPIPPVFKPWQITNWVRSLANTLTDDLETKSRLVTEWTTTIVQSCARHNQELHTDRVYEHIKMSLDLLQDRRKSINDLYQLIEKWKQLYAQTPP